MPAVSLALTNSEHECGYKEHKTTHVTSIKRNRGGHGSRVRKATILLSY